MEKFRHTLRLNLNRLLLKFLPFLFLIGCQSFFNDSSGHLKEKIAEENKNFPSNSEEDSSYFSKEHENFDITKDRSFLLPKQSVLLGKIKRQRAQFRQGPGAEFNIQDNWLTLGSDIIIFNEVRFWVRVIDIKSKKSGWVHKQTVDITGLNKEPFRLDIDLFPRVFSITALSKAQPYLSTKEIQVFFPKGTSFYALQIHPRRSLIWENNKKSMFWVSSYEVQ